MLQRKGLLALVDLVYQLSLAALNSTFIHSPSGASKEAH